jgi:hypothetical protein
MKMPEQDKGYHMGGSDYQGTFSRPARRDYSRNLSTFGMGTASKVSLAHDPRNTAVY